MSVDTFVFLRDDQLPTCEQLQAALDRAKAGIVLDPTDDLRKHSGYLPAKHRGQDSGFEWNYGLLAKTFGGEAPAGLGERTHAVNFVTHSDLRELVCALVTGAVLAQLSDGLVPDENTGQLISGDKALQIAFQIEKEEL